MGGTEEIDVAVRVALPAPLGVFAQGEHDGHPAIGGEQAGGVLDHHGPLARGRIRRARLERLALPGSDSEAVGDQEEDLRAGLATVGQVDEEPVELAPERGGVRPGGRRRAFPGTGGGPVPLHSCLAREVGEHLCHAAGLAGGRGPDRRLRVGHDHLHAGDPGQLGSLLGQGESRQKHRLGPGQGLVCPDHRGPSFVADGGGLGDGTNPAVLDHDQVLRIVGEGLQESQVRRLEDQLDLAHEELVLERLPALGGYSRGQAGRQKEEGWESLGRHLGSGARKGHAWG